METKPESEIKFGSVELALKLGSILASAEPNKEKVLKNLTTTLGIDLSDLWDVAADIEKLFVKIATTTDRLLLSDYLARDIEARLDGELLWHANQVVAKNEPLQAGIDTFEENSRYPIPDEINKQGNGLAEEAFASIKKHLDEFGTDSELQDEVREALIEVAQGMGSIKYLISMIYETKEKDCILPILDTLTSVLNKAILTVKFTVPLLGELSEELDPDEDNNDDES